MNTVKLIFEGPRFKRSLKVALIVGSLLASINYGDKILQSLMTNTDWIKLSLTYFVPFGVASYASISEAKKV